MENEEFEKELTKKVKASRYEVKTSVTKILEASSVKTQERRGKIRIAFSTPQKWIVGALSAIAVTALALAIYFPVKQALTPAEADFPDAALEEPTTTIAAKKSGAMAYEINSLLTSFSSQNASSMFKTRQTNSLTSDTFASAVTSYEDIQTSVYGALELDSLTKVSLSAGTYTGKYGEYPFALSFPNGSFFYFNLDVTDELSASGNGIGIRKTKEFEGEIALPSGEAYLVNGTRTVRLGNRSNIALTVFLNDAKTDYFEVNQNTTKGSFFFSFSMYTTSKLTYGYSIHLMKATFKNESTARWMVAAEFTSSDDWSSFTFRIVTDSNGAYLIYLSGIKTPISLFYEGGKRHYTYGDLVIDK